MRAYPDATIIGLTATPCRGDGRGLGNIFDRIIETPQIPDLIPPGYLVDCTVYAPVDKDIAKGVRISKGDYAQELLGRHMNRPELVGAIVPHWFKHADNQRTICFAASVDHSIAIVDQFVQAGVIAEHIDGKTPKEDRDAILARLASGETKVVSNFGVLTKGWDCPAASVCILARPTKQMGLFRQMVGRVLRPDPATGKTRALLLDHAGATWWHGFITDRMEWTLKVDKRAENMTEKARKAAEEKLRECPQCKAVMIMPPCVHCGWVPAPRCGEDRDYVDEDLGLVINGHVRRGEMTRDQQLQFYRELRGYAAMRGYKDGWAFRQCEQKGFKPPWAWRDYPPLDPSPAVAAWARSRIIAFAKGREPQP
jgi:DNA repair protein RadD